MSEEPNVTKKVIINQDGGLGDILYLQTLVKLLDCDNIVWPLSENFYDAAISHLKNDKITYIEKTEFLKNKDSYVGYSILDFDKAHLHSPDEIRGYMYSKYKFLGLHPSKWMENFSYTRNYKKENELYKSLDLPNNYKLLNFSFGSSPGTVIREDLTQKFKDEDNCVYIGPVEGYSLFDWSKVIEKAAEIHTVETAVCYLVEYLETTDKLYMYLKGDKEMFLKHYDGWEYITELHTKKWKYEDMNYGRYL